MKIISKELDKDQYKNKCPYIMKPIGITIHETDNNATAISEISYMQRNTNEVSFHFAVDEINTVQGLPLNRNSWNAGDGAKGKGNRQTIAIEICKNYKVNNLKDYYKGRGNAEKLAGYLMHKYNWTDKDIYTHNNHSGKNCPRVILSEGYINKFKDNAMKWKAHYSGATSKPVKSNTVIAKEVLRGDWGNGQARRNKLTAAGYDATVIQKIVNSGATSKPVKSNTAIAKEVLRGDWGNGQARRNKLTAAGYDATVIQKIVNKL